MRPCPSTPHRRCNDPDPKHRPAPWNDRALDRRTGVRRKLSRRPPRAKPPAYQRLPSLRERENFAWPLDARTARRLVDQRTRMRLALASNERQHQPRCGGTRSVTSRTRWEQPCAPVRSGSAPPPCLAGPRAASGDEPGSGPRSRPSAHAPRALARSGRLSRRSWPADVPNSCGALARAARRGGTAWT